MLLKDMIYFCDKDHRTYGGVLSDFDFDGHCYMANMATKIVAANNVDKICKTFYENFTRRKEN